MYLASCVYQTEIVQAGLNSLYRTAADHGAVLPQKLQRCCVKLQSPRRNSDSLPSTVHEHETDTFRSICKLYKEYIHPVVTPRRNLVSVHKCSESFGRFIPSFRAGVVFVDEVCFSRSLIPPLSLSRSREKGNPEKLLVKPRLANKVIFEFFGGIKEYVW